MEHLQKVARSCRGTRPIRASGSARPSQQAPGTTAHARPTVGPRADRQSDLTCAHRLQQPRVRAARMIPAAHATSRAAVKITLRLGRAGTTCLACRRCRRGRLSRSERTPPWSAPSGGGDCPWRARRNVKTQPLWEQGTGRVQATCATATTGRGTTATLEGLDGRALCSYSNNPCGDTVSFQESRRVRCSVSGWIQGTSGRPSSAERLVGPVIAGRSATSSPLRSLASCHWTPQPCWRSPRRMPPWATCRAWVI